MKHLFGRLDRYLRRWIFPKGLLSRSVLIHKRRAFVAEASLAFFAVDHFRIDDRRFILMANVTDHYLLRFPADVLSRFAVVLSRFPGEGVLLLTMILITMIRSSIHTPESTAITVVSVLIVFS